MAQAAANRLSSAVDRHHAVEKENAQKAAAKAKAKSGSKKVTTVASGKQNILDHASGVLKEIPCTVLLEGLQPAGRPAKLVTDIPRTFRVDPRSPIMSRDRFVRQTCSDYADAFAGGTERADPGRSQRLIEGECAEEIVTFVDSVFVENHIVSSSKTKVSVQKSIAPRVFAIAQSRATCSGEPGHLSTVRLVVSGTRKVMFVNTVKLWMYLDEVMKISPVSMKKMYEWVKTASLDAIKAFCAWEKVANDDVVLVGTLGSGDMSYLPAGWLFFERIMNVDAIGIKVQFLSKEDLPQLQTLNGLLLSGVPAPNELLQSAVDSLELAE